MYQDTIAAIATPPGESALGIVRLSGPDALAIAQRVFSARLRDRRLVLGRIQDPQSGEAVDEAMGAYLAAPRTYTREDMVEFSCHGGTVPLQRALELLLRAGARLANPGEFTLRAFLNGRIDLAQAEAVLDIIQAKTQSGLQVALQGLEGRLSARVRALRATLLEPLAYLTALVDFPEDEVLSQEVEGPLEVALQVLQELAASADQGMVYRQGVRTAMVGCPNVGKSSLLNRLLGLGRAIVTPVPGTTRDTLEELANIRGIPFILIDTAGITTTDDPVERLGVERSHQAIATADLVLLVLDASQPRDSRDGVLAERLEGRRVLVAANKCDLPPAQEPEPSFAGVQATGKEAGEALGGGLSLAPPAATGEAWPLVRTSALTGEGIDELMDTMAALVLGGRVAPADVPLVSNPRHQAALARATRHVAAALGSYRQGMEADFVTIDISGAVNALGEITGESVEDDLLDAIFSKFCIGK